ncbi:hypothetical protein ALQ14_103225 [Pseudomonas savastanoi pv. glycinea]|nr:hypothetical protein ALQ14_103225 [Pseudomonas savastanoi pv. glycinea]
MGFRLTTPEWSLRSIALHSPPALLPVSVLAELKPGSCLYLS